MEQQGEAVAQLTNQSTELLSDDVCSRHGPAAELWEQVCGNWNGFMGVLEWENERLGVSVPQISELEDMWAGEEEVLRQSLCDVEEKVSESLLSPRLCL